MQHLTRLEQSYLTQIRKGEIVSTACLEKICSLLECQPGDILEYTDMQSAFEMIKKLAKKGDVCLLSPAAASYDRYKNFEERGVIFKDFANKF